MINNIDNILTEWAEHAVNSIIWVIQHCHVSTTVAASADIVNTNVLLFMVILVSVEWIQLKPAMATNSIVWNQNDITNVFKIQQVSKKEFILFDIQYIYYYTILQCKNKKE